LTTAKEIAANLNEQMSSWSVSQREPQTAHSPDGGGCGWANDAADTEPPSSPFPQPVCANGDADAMVKQELPEDEAFQVGEHYHTPLLTFDEVDVPPKGLTRTPSDRSQPDKPKDDFGRDQLLYPEPVDGVSERTIEFFTGR